MCVHIIDSFYFMFTPCFLFVFFNYWCARKITDLKEEKEKPKIR